MPPRLLSLRYGSSCNTNFSEFYGKYLDESLEVLTAVLLKFQVLRGVCDVVFLDKKLPIFRRIPVPSSLSIK